jgi:hypothetical protein
VSLQITILKVLAGQPKERASTEYLSRYVSVLMASGADWADRTKRWAARAPKLDIIKDSFVVRDHLGWRITEDGRRFLASLDAPVAATPEVLEAATPEVLERDAASAPVGETTQVRHLRLVVDNGKQAA